MNFAKTENREEIWIQQFRHRKFNLQSTVCRDRLGTFFERYFQRIRSVPLERANRVSFLDYRALYEFVIIRNFK